MTETSGATMQWRPFEVMERLENEDILQELRGEMIETLVYEFTGHDGRRVMGLSKAGVDWVASEMAMKGEVLRELDFQLLPDSENVTAVVKAGRFAVSQDGREVLLETVFGTKRQPRRREVYVRDKDGEPVIEEGHPLKRTEDDPFVIEVAMMKAARNAKRRLMPESLIARVIGMAREEGRVTRLESLEEAATEPSIAARPEKADIRRESFVLQARERGYASWREILNALKLGTAGELREMTYRKALERLPRKSRPEHDRDLPLEEELQDEDADGFGF